MPKTIRLDTTHYFIMEIHNRKCQQTAANHLSEIDFKDFSKLYKDYNK